MKNWNYNALKSQTDNEFDFVASVLNEILENKQNVRVLDVGCSDGYNTEKMFGQFDNVDVVGIDISKDAIDKAQSNIKRDNMTFECVNIENDGELNDFYNSHEKFDIVYCSHLVQHLNDVTSFVKKVHYFMLKPQGYFIIKTIDDATKQANQENDMLQNVLYYYQKYVAPFQELRRHTNRYIGSTIPYILDGLYANISRYDYIQTTEGLSVDNRLQLYNKCFHFRGTDDCIRIELPQDKEYLEMLERLKALFVKDDYVFSTTTLLFVALNK